jgi:hypothetical protein
VTFLVFLVAVVRIMMVLMIAAAVGVKKVGCGHQSCAEKQSNAL